MSNEEGSWTIAVLPLGNYEVTAGAAGFQLVKQTTTVVTSQTTSIDLTLGIAGADAVVNIVADQPGIEPVRSDSPVTGISVTGRSLEDSPVANRSSFGRINLDTAASGDIADPLTNGTGNPEVSINGSRTTSQGVQFNGIDATNFFGTGSLTESISPAPETVQEVKLLSSLYDASLGRNGGGSVQVVTRSGTNAFTGAAYLFAQNEKFNSNDFFFNRDGIERQKARRLEGGVTLGGPIIKDKLWFFGGYQKTDAITAYVPTAQSFVTLPEALAFITDRTNPENVRLAFLRSTINGGAISSFGNPFSLQPGPGTAGYCVRPLTAAAFAGLAVATCIDPNSPGFRLLNLRNPATGDFFIPTLPAGRYERLFYDNANVRILENGVVRITDFARFGLPNGLPIIDGATQGTVRGGFPLVRFRNVFPAEFKQDQFTTRLDYNLLKGDAQGNNLNTINGTFFFANFPAVDPFSDDTLVSPTPLIRDDRNRTLAITDTHYFNGSLTNEARFGYFSLDNSRQLDERFLAPELTNTGLGIINPATAFEPGAPS